MVKRRVRSGHGRALGRTTEGLGSAAAAAALLLLAAATPAVSQTCLGAQLPVPGVAVLGGAGFVAHDFEGDVTGAEYGIEGRSRLPLGFAGSAGVWRRSLDGDANPTVLRLEASWTIPTLPVPTFGTRVCPLLGLTGSLVRRAEAGNDFTNRTVPIGLGVGLPLTVGDELGLTPFVAFRWLFSRVDGEVLMVPTEQSDDSASLELGTGARLGRLLGIASLSFAGLDGAVGPAAYPDRLFTIKVGYVF